MRPFSTGGFVLGSKKCYFCKTTLDKKTVQDAAPEYLCGCGFPIETHVVESILNIEREVPDTTPTTLPPPKMIESDRKCPWCGLPYPSSQDSLWDAGECYACGRDLTGTSEHGTFTDIYASIVEGRVVALVVGGDFDGDTIELFNTAKQNFGRAEIIDKLGHFDGVEKISSSHLKVVEDDSKGRRIVDAGSLNGTRPESTHLNTGGDIELAGVLTLRIPSAEKQGSADYPHDPNPVAIPEIPEISVPSSIPLPPSPKGKKGPPPPPDYVPPEITARVTEGPMAGKTFQIPWPAETKPETLGREDFREALGEFDGLEMISGEHLEITYESMTGVSRISIEDAGSTNGSDPERVEISILLSRPRSVKSSKPMEIAGAITLEFYLSSAVIDSGEPESAEAEQPPEEPSLFASFAIPSDRRSGEESESDATMCTIDVVDASGNTADSAQMTLDGDLTIGRAELLDWFGDFDGHTSVSRQHLSFESQKNDVWVVKDAGSSNGTSPSEVTLGPDEPTAELRVADAITLRLSYLPPSSD